MGIIEQVIKNNEYGFNYNKIEDKNEIIHMFELRNNGTPKLFISNIEELKHQARVKGKNIILRYNPFSDFSIYFKNKRSFNLIDDGTNIINKPTNGICSNISNGTFIIGDKTIVYLDNEIRVNDKIITDLSTIDITFIDGVERYYMSRNPFEMDIVEKPILNNDNGANFIETENDIDIMYTFDLKPGLIPSDFITNISRLKRQGDIKKKSVKLKYCPRSQLSKFNNRIFKMYNVNDIINEIPTEDIYINEPVGTLTLGDKIIKFNVKEVNIGKKIISDIDTVDITFGNDIRRYYIKNNPIEIGIVEQPIINLEYGHSFTETETDTCIKYNFIVNYNTKISKFLTNIEELSRIADIKNKEMKLKYIPRTKMSKYFGYKRDYKVFNNNSIVTNKPLTDMYMFNNSGTIQLGNKTVIYDENNINIDGINIPENQPVELNFGDGKTTYYFEHGSLSCGTSGSYDDPIVDKAKSTEITDTITTKLVTVNSNIVKDILNVAEQLDFRRNK